MMIDYQIRFVHFSGSRTKETISANADGSYTIFIEASLSKEEQQKAFIHAMKHILGDDFSKENIDRIEKNAQNTILSDGLCTVF